MQFESWKIVSYYSVHTNVTYKTVLIIELMQNK